MGEADDEDEDSDDSEDDDEAIKDEFKFHMKVEGEGGGLLVGGPNSGAPVTLSVVEGTNEITGEPTRVEFDPSQPLTTEIMGGRSIRTSLMGLVSVRPLYYGLEFSLNEGHQIQGFENDRPLPIW